MLLIILYLLNNVLGFGRGLENGLLACVNVFARGKGVELYAAVGLFGFRVLYVFSAEPNEKNNK